MSNDNSAHLIIVTDCGGTDEPRYGIAAWRSFHPCHVDISFLLAEPMSTFHAGFLAAAHALSTIDHFGPLREGENIGMIVNAAPRYGRRNGRELRGDGREIDGEEIYALLLKNGVWVVGPNAGFNFHFFRKQISESYLVTDTSGLSTPFRSMELMIPALAKVLEMGTADLSHIELTPQEPIIAEPEVGIFVGDWDSFGNMYLVINLAPGEWLPELGGTIRVTIGNRVHWPKYVDGIFAGKTNELTLTQGSLMLGGQPVYYIVLVGGSAHSLFGNPSVGTPVKIERD